MPLLIAVGMLAVVLAKTNAAFQKKHWNGQIRRSVSDPYETLHVAIEGDSLVVRVAYSGGCADHQFNLEPAALS